MQGEREGRLCQCRMSSWRIILSLRRGKAGREGGREGIALSVSVSVEFLENHPVAERREGRERGREGLCQCRMSSWSPITALSGGK
jgi:hypothetical protein